MRLFEGYMKLSYLISKRDKTYETPDKTFSPENYRSYARNLARNWKYKNDGLFGTINRIEPPHKASLKKTGDCDDFASHMLYYAREEEGYLITYFTKDIREAHTIPVIKHNKVWYATNWSRTYSSENKDLLIKVIESIPESKVFSMHAAKFDYGKGRYISVTKDFFGR